MIYYQNANGFHNVLLFGEQGQICPIYCQFHEMVFGRPQSDIIDEIHLQGCDDQE